MLERRDLLAVSIIDDGDTGYSSFVPEVIIDNGEAGYTESGTWANSGLSGYGSDSRYAYNRAGSANYLFNRLDESYYQLWANTPGHSNSTTQAKYTINNGSSSQIVTLNQVNGTNGWQLLGTYQVTNAYLNVSLTNANTTGVLRADALMVVPVFPVWRDSSLGGYEHGNVQPGDSDYSYRGTATYEFAGLTPGANEIAVSIPSNGNSATSAQYKIYDSNNTLLDTVTKNQVQIGGSWHVLGNYTLSGTTARVEVTNGGTSGAVRADAVRISSFNPTGDFDFVDPLVVDEDGDTAEHTTGTTIAVGQAAKIEVKTLNKDDATGHFRVYYDNTAVKLYDSEVGGNIIASGSIVTTGMELFAVGEAVGSTAITLKFEGTSGTSGSVNTEVDRVKLCFIKGEIDFVNPFVIDDEEEDYGATVDLGHVGKLQISELDVPEDSLVYVKYDRTKITLYLDEELNEVYESESELEHEGYIDLWAVGDVVGSSSIELFTKIDSNAAEQRLDWVAFNVKKKDEYLKLASGKTGEGANIYIPQDKKESVGAIVLLNDDDDDSDNKADLEDDKMNGDEAAHDFHKLHIIGNPEWKSKGEFVLSFSSTNIRIRKADGALVESEVTTFAGNQETTLFIEGIAKSNEIAKEKISLKTKVNGNISAEPIDRVSSTVVKFNLAASTMGLGNIAGDDFSEFLEESRGAYVIFNNDQDAYKIVGSGNTLKVKPDYELGEKNTLENDLLRVKMKKPELNVGGSLSIETSKPRGQAQPARINLWDKADKSNKLGALSSVGGPNDPKKLVYDNPASEFWVEGISPNQDGETLVLKWSSDIQDIAWADAVNFKVFGITGPLNVPDHSIHDYQVTGAASEDRSKWMLNENGGNAATVIDNTNTMDTLTRTWGANAEKSFVTYQADENFIYQVEVNVVKVSLGNTNTIAYSNTGLGAVANPNNNFIQSRATGGLAMQNQVRVVLEAPMWSDGSKRGAEFIEVGIIQVVRVGANDWQTTFPNDPTIRSKFSGDTLLDQITQPASVRPWYDWDGTKSSTSVENGRGVRVLGTDLDQNNSILLSTGDRPVLPVSLNRITGVATNTLLINFDLTIAARTADTSHGSDSATKIYSSQATASWLFNGSGNYDANGAWIAGPNVGNAGDASFSEAGAQGQPVNVFVGQPAANDAWRSSGGFN